MSHLDAHALAALAEEACHFRLAELEGEPAGFLLALAPGARYASPNFRWFCERYRDFVYIDRIVVATEAGRRGLGRALYADLERTVPPGTTALACEVNLRPPNPGSLAFHERLGFREVGRQEATSLGETKSKKVRMLLKPLSPSTRTGRGGVEQG